jgi:RNA polymerase subunit RPABC4/transcription elongation factor Spt4/xanthosine utilization system XapX-like protein
MPSERIGSPSPADACRECGRQISADARFCPGCGADLRGRSGAARCADCGEGFDPDDRFCSNCGASRTDAEGESKRSFRRRVQDHLDAGWEVERDDGDRVLVVDRGIGSAGIHLLLLLFTGGVGNLLYGWWHYSTLAERRRLVRGDSTAVRAPSRSERGRRTETVSAYLLSGLLLLVGGWIAVISTASSAPPLALVGLAIGLLGAGAAPPVQRRLRRRHGVTTFGRQRTVDHRVIRPPESVDEPCVVCGEAFDRGLVRRRRDETVVAGVPVRTRSVRRNHYCVDCARSELFGDGLDADAFSDVDRSTAREPPSDVESASDDRSVVDEDPADRET